MTRVQRVSTTLFVGVLLVGAWGEVRAQDTSGPMDTTSGIQARHALDRWALGGAYSIVQKPTSETEPTLSGPAFCVTRLNPGGVGFDLTLTYIVPTGDLDFGGGSADVGLVYGVPVSENTVLLLKGGAAAYGAGGDCDDCMGLDIALYPAIGLVQRISGAWAVTAEADARFSAFDGDAFFGGKIGFLILR